MRYLALGDSYTVGEGVAPEEQWPRHLARLLRARGVDVGEPLIIARTAWATDELCDAIDAAPPKGKFDLVSLMVGVNDNYRARSHELFEKEFRRVLSRAMRFARSPDRTVVVSIPDWGAAPFAEGRDRKLIAGEVDGFNGRARPLVERACARWVDVTEASRGMLTDPSLVAPDGLHPSGEMYRRWAEIIAREAIAALGGD